MSYSGHFKQSNQISRNGGVGYVRINDSGETETSSHLRVSGTINGDTSLTLDSTTITTAEIGVLDGVTAGTATASKALVVDSNKDIGTIRNLTIDGAINVGSDASGDMYYRNSSGVLARIAVGSDNQVLTLNGDVPGWEAASGGGGSVSGNTFATDLKIGRDADNHIDFATTDNEISLHTNGSERMVILSDGNVGIGNDNPTQQLHLKQDYSGYGSFNNTLFVNNINTTSSSHTAIIFGQSHTTGNRGEMSFKYIGNNSDSNAITFGFHNSGEKLNILRNGRVGIGTTNPDWPLTITLTRGDANWRYYSNLDAFEPVYYTSPATHLQGGRNGASQQQFLELFRNYINIGITAVHSGWIYCHGILWHSDSRIKENIALVKSNEVLLKLDRLNVFNYNYNKCYRNDNQYHFGFIAQDVYTVLPSCVTMNEDINTYTDEETNETITIDNMMSIDDSEILALAVAGVKIIRKKVKTLEEKVEILETQNSEKDIKIQSLEDQIASILTRLTNLESI